MHFPLVQVTRDRYPRLELHEFYRVSRIYFQVPWCIVFIYTCVLQVQRLRDELSSSRAQLATWDERINQARAACAAWQMESEEAKRKATIAEQQRDEVNIMPNLARDSFLISKSQFALLQRMDFLQALKALRVENKASNSGPYLHSLRKISELRSLSIATLKSIQSQLRSDLEEVEKVKVYATICENKCQSFSNELKWLEKK